MNPVKKYWPVIKKKSPTILSVAGSLGVGVTAYLAARNEAKYQHARIDYYLEHGVFPEEYGGINGTKEEIKQQAYRIFQTHMRQHLSTFVSGGITIASILGGNAIGNKQNTALAAMSLGMGNMMAKRKEAEDKIIEKQPEEKKGFVSREDVQDYLIFEAYNNDLVYYTNLESQSPDEEFVWVEAYPGNKIFVLSHNSVTNLEWYINKQLRETNRISLGEIFDYLDIYSHIPKDVNDSDIDNWLYMYGFSKEEDEEMKIEVFTRPVEVEDGVIVIAMSFSSVANAIYLM